MYDVILVICASMQVYLCSMASIFSTILLISAVAIILASGRLDVEPNTSEGFGTKPYVLAWVCLFYLKVLFCLLVLHYVMHLLGIEVDEEGGEEASSLSNQLEIGLEKTYQA